MSRRRAVAIWLLKLAVSAGLIWLLVYRADLSAIGTAMRKIPPATVLLLIGLYLAGAMLSGAKWRLLVPEQPVHRLFALNLVAQFYSIALAGQLAGEAVKAYKLARGRADAERIAASVVVDKITGLLAVLVLGVAGLHAGQTAVPAIIAWPLAGVLALGIAALLMLRLAWIHALALSVARAVFGFWARLAAGFQQFFDAWRSFASRPWTLGASIVLGCVVQVLSVAVIVLISRHLGIGIAIGDWLWVFAVVSVATVLPLSLGGIGIREGAFVGVLGFLGYPAELALALSFTIFGLQLFGAALGAAIDFSGWGLGGAARNAEGPGAS